VAYTVTKLTDYSAAALEKAAGECIAACTAEGAEVRSEADLKTFRDRWMGRKNGILTQINDLWLKGAPKEAKREAGMRVNELKTRITELVEAAHMSAAANDSLASESVDISLPGIRRPIGAEHPVIKTRNEIVSVFEKLGYSVAEGPVVETDYYNFEALNFRRTIRRATPRTRCSSPASSRSRSASACSCAHIRLRCRFAPWRRCVRRFVS
jgi:phenylalanyl-tRNA synthetase alpha chain